MAQVMGMTGWGPWRPSELAGHPAGPGGPRCRDGPEVRPTPEAAESRRAGRGECGSELTMAGQSARVTALTTGAGYSPRLGGTHHATDHVVVSGLGYRLRRPRPFPRSAGSSRPTAPSASVRPGPGLQRGKRRGLPWRLRRGWRSCGCEGGALVLVGLSCSPWSGPGFGVVCGRASSPALPALGGGGVDGWGWWRSPEPRGAALARGSRRPVAAAPRRAAGRAFSCLQPSGRPGPSGRRRRAASEFWLVFHLGAQLDCARLGDV